MFGDIAVLPRDAGAWSAFPKWPELPCCTATSHAATLYLFGYDNAARVNAFYAWHP